MLGLLEKFKGYMWPVLYFYWAVLFWLIQVFSYTKVVPSFKGIVIPLVKVDVSS